MAKCRPFTNQVSHGGDQDDGSQSSRFSRVIWIDHWKVLFTVKSAYLSRNWSRSSAEDRRSRRMIFGPDSNLSSRIQRRWMDYLNDHATTSSLIYWTTVTAKITHFVWSFESAYLVLISKGQKSSSLYRLNISSLANVTPCLKKCKYASKIGSSTRISAISYV